MLNDSPEIQIISFIPAYARNKCPAWIPLTLNLIALLAICFAPAYMNTVVETLGTWALWTWMALVAASIGIAAFLTPWPAYDTYIVKAEKEALSAYQKDFDITYIKKDKTWRLERKV